MASSQPSTQDLGQRSRKGGGISQNARASASASEDTDIEEDELFALVSVLYHALQGASASRKYINDAQTASDDELKEFFQRCRMEDGERASEAKRLLVSRVDEEDDEDDEDGSAQSDGEESEDEDNP
ncbi:MAG TPA: hypothetical protein VGL19_11690 [Polyangiaceae bacterium]